MDVGNHTIWRGWHEQTRATTLRETSQSGRTSTNRDKTGRPKEILLTTKEVTYLWCWLKVLVRYLTHQQGHRRLRISQGNNYLQSTQNWEVWKKKQFTAPYGAVMRDKFGRPKLLGYTDQVDMKKKDTSSRLDYGRSKDEIDEVWNRTIPLMILYAQHQGSLKYPQSS